MSFAEVCEREGDAKKLGVARALILKELWLDYALRSLILLSIGWGARKWASKSLIMGGLER